MSKIVSFRLGDALVPEALKKLKLGESDYKEFTSQLNNVAYSLMVGWLTDDRDKEDESELNRLADAVDSLTLKIEVMEDKLERDRLDDRVSELLNEIDTLKLEVKDLTG